MAEWGPPDALPRRLADTGTLAQTSGRELAGSLSERHWTRIGLVNNAAMPGALGPSESIDPASLLRHAAVNWVAPAQGGAAHDRDGRGCGTRFSAA